MAVQFRIWRSWPVALAAVLAFGGIALAGTVIDPPTVVLTLSPDGAAEGTDLDAGDVTAFEVGVAGLPGTVYDVVVTVDGDVGSCAEGTGTVTGDEAGEGTWTCSFTAADHDGEEPLVGSLTFDVSVAGEDAGYLVAPVTVHAVEVAEPEDDELEADEAEDADDDGANHGQCVSHWVHEAKAAGLTGRWKGAFVSAIAADVDAVKAKDADHDDRCDYADALDEALQQQQEAQAELEAARAAKVAEREQAKADRAAAKEAKGQDKHADDA